MQADFPSLAGWRSVRFWAEGMALATDESLSGVDTIVPTMRGRWMATGELVIHGRAKVLQWQAFLGQMQGRVGTTLVPCFSRYRPMDRFGRVLSFAPPAFELPARVWLRAGAARRARDLDVDLGDALWLEPGQYFSLGDRLHQIRTCAPLSGGGQRLTFHPPLRVPVRAGDAVEVDRPVCRMRFTAETEGVFPHHYSDIAPSVTVNFVEAL